MTGHMYYENNVRCTGGDALHLTMSSQLGHDRNLSSFGSMYTRYHGYVSLCVCVSGIITNTFNVTVLTRRKMRTPVNQILTGLALSDIITMLSYVPFAIHFYCLHPAGDSTPAKNSYGWMFFLLFHINLTTVTHTISIWLCVVLAIVRYLHIRNPSRVSSARFRRITQAKYLVLAVYLLSVVVMIPNYLTNEIKQEQAFLTLPVGNHTDPGVLPSIQEEVTKDVLSVPGLGPPAVSEEILLARVNDSWTNRFLFSSAGSGKIASAQSSSTTSSTSLAAATTTSTTSSSYSSSLSATPSSHLSSTPAWTGNQTIWVLKSLRLGSSEVEPLVLVNVWMYAALAKILPCVLMFIFGSLLLHQMRDKIKQRRNFLKFSASNSHKLREHSRTTKMLIAVIVLFILTEFPQGVLIMLSATKEGFFDNVYLPLGDVMDIVALVNNAINFVLYCSMSTKFRETFLCLYCRCQSSDARGEECEPEDGDDEEEEEDYGGQRKNGYVLKDKAANSRCCSNNN